MHAEQGRAGQVFGDYELVRLLATGGMAEVYEARRAGIHGFSKRFALKRILPQLARDERLVQMFCDEARIHAALSHPNLVEVVDFGEEHGQLYMVMEFVEGLSAGDLMSAVVARRRRFELGPALYCAREVANALAYAHDASDDSGRALGLIHRDVAPSNILVSYSGAIKLADFGIMRSSIVTQRTAPGEVKGKIGYVSPEQAVGAPLDARSDLFSLAVVITEMLLGRPLFPGRNEFEVLRSLHAGDLSMLRMWGRHIPADVTAILLRSLSKVPGQRHPTARAFAADIHGAIRRHRVELGPRGMADWLTDLGIAPIDSHVRQKPSPYLALEQDALREAITLRREATGSEPEIVTVRPSEAKPASLPALPAPYRMRRGDTINGPYTLPRMLELVATGACAGETPVSFDDGPFAALESRIELARLAVRPAWRFADFVGLRAGARWPIHIGTLPRHLFELARGRRTGLLCARSEHVRVRAYFLEGEPVFATSTRNSELFGQRLVEAGLVDAVTLERILAQGWSTGQRVGEALVTTGLLDPPAVMMMLAGQRLARLTTLCRMREGELLFVDGEQCGEPIQPLGAPFKLLARAVRDGYDDATLEMLLADAASMTLFATPQASECAAALDLPPQEAYVLARGGRGETLATLIEHMVAGGQMDAPCVRRAVFLGLSAGAVTARIC
jgi:eukaryotic-like serine/threonine-protein kinase